MTAGTRAPAGQVATTLAASDRGATLPGALLEFAQSTDRLVTLRKELVEDVELYTTYAAKLAEFDREMGDGR